MEKAKQTKQTTQKNIKQGKINFALRTAEEQQHSGGEGGGASNKRADKTNLLRCDPMRPNLTESSTLDPVSRANSGSWKPPNDSSANKLWKLIS